MAQKLAYAKNVLPEPKVGINTAMAGKGSVANSSLVGYGSDSQPNTGWTQLDEARARSLAYTGGNQYKGSWTPTAKSATTATAPAATASVWDSYSNNVAPAGMKYSYDQWKRMAQEAGVYDQFGAGDFEYIKENPDMGVGLISYKTQYANATTPEEKQRIAEAAQNLRISQGGYTVDPTGKYAIPESTGDYYENKINSLLRGLQGAKFSYDPNEDPLYSEYRKQYLREGQRAMQDTLASTSAMTGGRPSSYAVSAASQANNNYAAQVADKIPELYNQAYSRWVDEFNRQAQTAQLMQQQREAQLARAEKEYSYGDTSKMTSLGIDTRNDPAKLQRDLEKAQYAYSLGDSRLLNDLGISTKNDLNMDILKAQRDQAWVATDTARAQSDLLYQQAQDAQWQSQLQKAQAAAQYGDYSLLKAMGFNTSRADFQNQLAIAQTIAQYTGDVSALRNLMY